MPNDRAAVAREVLTEAADHFGRNGEVFAENATRHYCATRYPTPPAPETVTVGDDVYSRRGDTWYVGGFNIGLTLRHRELLDRIASDARVLKERDAQIAELERELDDMSQRHTDVCEKWSDENRRRVQLTERIAAQEARIAELEVELHETRERQLPMVRLRDEAYRQRDAARARIAELENELRRALDGTVFHEKQAYEARTERDAALRALEASKHPVATRETVERVALAVRDADLSRSYLVPMHVYHKLARAALTAAGFTLEEGA